MNKKIQDFFIQFFIHRALKKKTTFILPTQTGMLFLGIFFTLFLTGLFYNNNLVLILAFVLITYFLVELFHAHHEFRVIGPGDILIKDGTNPLEIELAGLKKGARVSLLTQKQELHVGDDRRGHYHVRGAKVVWQKEQLFTLWKYLKIKKSFYIYPKALVSKEKLKSLQENLQLQAYDIPYQLKRFQPEDRVSMIYWKSIARHAHQEHEFERHLVSKDFRSDDKNEIKIYWERLDADKEVSISVAAWMINFCYQKQIDWQLLDSETSSLMTKGRTHWRESMEKLSEA